MARGGDSADSGRVVLHALLILCISAGSDKAKSQISPKYSALCHGKALRWQVLSDDDVSVVYVDVLCGRGRRVSDTYEYLIHTDARAVSRAHCASSSLL